MDTAKNKSKLKRLGIDTHKEAVVFVRKDCHICRSEGFEVHARVKVSLDGRHVLATLSTVNSDILARGEASLSEYAWKLLSAESGDAITLSHPEPLHSLSYVRSKIYGHGLDANEINEIISDIVKVNYSDINIATFLTACAGGRINRKEITELTKAMVNTGDTISWDKDLVVDKHCVGGLPGNRTTLIVTPIVAAFGLTMPKTSSRAITSPSGTADTMETLAPVELSLQQMQDVVERENACIVWGGAVSLSPADDILIQVERTMDLDSEGQLIASLLSKKIAAGSNHIVIDMPIGPTAKIRSGKVAKRLAQGFINVSRALGLSIEIINTEGNQPVGRGIGPALEAKDVLSVLQNDPNAPQDLAERSLLLAGKILEFSPKVKKHSGLKLATEILESGKAWEKFQAICDAQGGMREPGTAPHSYVICSKHRGRVNGIDNRQIARVAKLAGAPHAKTAGVLLHTPLETLVEKDQPLFTIFAESKGELEYALSLVERSPNIVQIEVHR